MVASVNSLMDAHRLMLRYLTDERPLNLEEMRIIDNYIQLTINNARPIIDSLPARKAGGVALVNNFISLNNIIGK